MNNDDNVFIAEVDKISKDDWSKLIREFKDANIFQTWEYGSEHRGENNLSHFILKRNEQIVAASQVWVFKIPFLELGFAHVSWGPMWKLRSNPVDLSIIKNMLKALRQEYAVRRGLLLRIRSYDVDNGNESQLIRNIFREEGFYFLQKERKYHTFILDLNPNLVQIRNNFKKFWRHNLNKAERKDLEIVTGSSDEMYQNYSRIYQDMLSRKKFQKYVSDLKADIAMQNKLPNDLKTMVFLCRYNDEIVAGGIVAAIGATGIDYGAATTTRCVEMKLQASYFIKWKIIEWLKENGFRYYDLRGGIDGEMPGVKFFKSGLGGDEVFYLGSFETCFNKTSFLLVRTGELLQNFRTKCGL
jgi:lipid II:glycine glycyltransferase (peptidoglycan interpeptide bridge formation enzyme)